MFYLLFLAFAVTTLVVDVVASPVCMKAMHDVLLPSCHSNACEETCCTALRVPEECADTEWGNAYTRYVLETIQKRQKDRCTPCRTRLRLPCAFSTQDASSPCFSSACEPLFVDGTLVSECKTVIETYCNALPMETKACKVYRETQQDANCTLLTKGFSLCSVSRQPSSEWPGSILQSYAATRLGKNVMVSSIGSKWATTYGCSFMAQGRCPCVDRVPELNGQGHRIMACAFSTPLPTCPPQATRELFAFAFLAPFLHIAASADEAIKRRFARNNDKRNV